MTIWLLWLLPSGDAHLPATAGQPTVRPPTWSCVCWMAAVLLPGMPDCTLGAWMWRLFIRHVPLQHAAPAGGPLAGVGRGASRSPLVSLPALPASWHACPSAGCTMPLRSAVMAAPDSCCLQMFCPPEPAEPPVPAVPAGWSQVRSELSGRGHPLRRMPATPGSTYTARCRTAPQSCSRRYRWSARCWRTASHRGLCRHTRGALCS